MRYRKPPPDEALVLIVAAVMLVMGIGLLGYTVRHLVPVSPSPGAAPCVAARTLRA